MSNLIKAEKKCVSPGSLVLLLRANFLPASITAFLLGAGLAFRNGYSLNPPRFFVGLAGVVFAHLAGNTVNNYCDHVTGADSENTRTTPFFGGTRVLVEGAISPVAALRAALVLGTAALISGVAIFLMTKDPVFIFIVASGGFLTLQYTAGPLRLSYRGLGEADIFFLFGPFLVMSAYYLFARSFTLESFMVSLIPGGLILSVITRNEIPDAATDRKAGKNNLAVILGLSGAERLYMCGLVLSAAALFVSIARGTLPAIALVCLPLYIPALARKICKVTLNGSEDTDVVLSGWAVFTHFVVTLAAAGILFRAA